MSRSQTDIALTAAVAVSCCIAATAGAPVPVMTVLGLALLSAPGYVWGPVLFGSQLSGLERVLVTTGLCLIVPVLGGLALYAAGVPLHRAGWLTLLTVVTLAGDVALLAGRPTDQVARQRRQSTGRRVAGWPVAIFGAAIVISAGGVGLASAGAAVQHQPGFTQLWLVPLHESEPTTASLGVSNHQGRAMRYRLVIRRNGKVSAAWNFTLRNDQAWHEQLQITGAHTVADLYRAPNLTRPYRRVSVRTARAPGS